MTPRLRRILLLLTLFTLPMPTSAQQAAGDWIGTLEVSESARLRLAVHLITGDGGTLLGTLDSIDQGAFGIPLADIAFTPESLSFTVPAVSGRYEGRWDAARSAWAGTWSQGGMSLPLDLTAAPAAPPPPPLPADWAVPDDVGIARLLGERIAARPGVGIVVGVIEPAGRRVVARGPAGGAPFDGATLFEIGSMTKVFTALLLADTAARGEVALDDPAERYLPEGARLPRRGGREISLRDLATHRSGLPRLPDNLPSYDLVNPYAAYDEARLFDFLGRHALTRDIGAQYEYSNVGMGLLGHLLARRAGTDLEALVRLRIAGPLGMRDTVVSLSPDQQARFAQGHDAELRPTSAWGFDALAGAGALRSTAQDMLAFLAAAIDPDATALAPALRALLAERWPGGAARVRTGLGWAVADLSGREVILHDGGTGGFRSIMAYDPERRRGVVVLTNAAAEPAANDLALHLLVGTPLAPMPPARSEAAP